MKQVLFSAALLAMIGLIGCAEENTASTESSEESTSEATAITADNVEALAELKFEEEAFDFGEITQGEKVEHTFKFVNTGENDLVIVSAKGSCGCTVPDWPRQPVAPGATGEMHVVFNSDGKSGQQHKKVTVVANTEPATSAVAIRGNVIVPEEGEVAEPAVETEG